MESRNTVPFKKKRIVQHGLSQSLRPLNAAPKFYNYIIGRGQWDA